MKKLVTTVLIVGMMALMSISAFAANSTSDYQTSVEIVAGKVEKGILTQKEADILIALLETNQVTHDRTGSKNSGRNHGTDRGHDVGNGHGGGRGHDSNSRHQQHDGSYCAVN